MAAQLSSVVIFLLLFFCEGAFSDDSSEFKLVMTQVLYRHGDRSPIHSFPKDLHPNYWPQGPGQLTQIGMNQEYKLGQFLKKRYMTDNKLLNETYLKSQVYCRSSDRDRTLMSAESQMAGLYPPKDKQVWNKDIDWQPIPVHTVPRSEDLLIRPWDVKCPRLGEIEKMFYKSDLWLGKEKKYKSLIEYINKKTGVNNTLESIYQIHDTILCEKSHNLTLPDWVKNDTVWQTLSTISAFDYVFLEAIPERKRLLGGSLVGEIINHMKDYRSRKEGLYKMYIYSGHDTSIVCLLQALDLYESVPPYSTAVMVELYEANSSKYIVKVMYRNFTDVDKAPIQYKMHDCSSADCPLDDFIRITEHVIPKDRPKECGIKTDAKVPNTLFYSSKQYKGILICLVVVSIILLLLSAWILCTKVRQRSRYRAHLIDPDAEQLIKEVAMMGGGVSGSDGEYSDS